MTPIAPLITRFLREHMPAFGAKAVLPRSGTRLASSYVALQESLITHLLQCLVEIAQLNRFALRF